MVDIVFSGIQPTGDLHIGNYLGAVRQWPALQKSGRKCIYCIVDLHAMTARNDPSTLRRHSLETAAMLMSVGIDPKEHILFIQSANPDHAGLTWVLSCIARMGWLQRMTQFKDKSGKNKEKASVGLFTYPILMASDILCYKASGIPVGDDQRQHLELCRDIAQSFNEYYGQTLFPLPEPIIPGVAQRVMSLKDGQVKMSKSDTSEMSRIGLQDTADTIANKIKKAKTDTQLLPSDIKELDSRPEATNLLTILAALQGKALADTVETYSGRNFQQLKKDLTEALVTELAPIQQRYQQYINDPKGVESILANGAQKAMSISNPVLNEVYRCTGLAAPC